MQPVIRPNAASILSGNSILHVRFHCIQMLNLARHTATINHTRYILWVNVSELKCTEGPASRTQCGFNCHTTLHEKLATHAAWRQTTWCRSVKEETASVAEMWLPTVLPSHALRCAAAATEDRQHGALKHKETNTLKPVAHIQYSIYIQYSVTVVSLRIIINLHHQLQAHLSREHTHTQSLIGQASYLHTHTHPSVVCWVVV